MTATKGEFPSARQAEYLGGLADEALAAEDATKAILTTVEAEKEAQTRERLRLGNAAIKYRAARLEAMGRCEAAAKAFTDAVRDVVYEAGQERAALVELKEGHADLLTEAAIYRRMSRYLSHQLRRLTGSASARFGEVQLANYFRAAVDWTTAERRLSAGLTSTDKGEDDAS